MKLTVRRDPEEWDAIEHLDSRLSHDTQKLPPRGFGPTHEGTDGLTHFSLQKFATRGGMDRRSERDFSQYLRPMIEICRDTSAAVVDFTNVAGEADQHISGSALKVGSYSHTCPGCMDLAYSAGRCPEHGAIRWQPTWEQKVPPLAPIERVERIVGDERPWISREEWDRLVDTEPITPQVANALNIHLGA